MERVLGVVLAGGNGTRLNPLTAEQAKPALLFANDYRIIDFVLSNLINSQIHPIHVLAQYKPQSLVEHIRIGWSPWSRGPDRRISVDMPRSDEPDGAFKGTADAVYKNLDLVARDMPDLVAVFAADHVYRMDVRQMVEFHRERKAEISIAAVPVPIAKGSGFGIIATDSEGRILDFQEKPALPAAMPGDPERAYASMGNYLFNADVLISLLEASHRRGDTDFGHHVLPRALDSHRVFAYDFASNTVPGIHAYEERGYWRDIGTLDAYRSAQQDVLGALPRFCLANPLWPLRRNCYRSCPDDLPEHPAVHPSARPPVSPSLHYEGYA